MSDTSIEHFKHKRKMVRASRQAIRQGKSTRERVATANIISRHGGKTAGTTSRLPNKIEVPKMKHTDSKMDLIYERLKQCQGDGGVVDPSKILSTMNMVQIEEDPEAYVPNIEKQHKRRQEMRKMEKWYEEQYQRKMDELDRALFDFDESVDNLSQVSDRYQADPATAFGLQGGELQSTEEQGKVKDTQNPHQNDERPNNPIEHCSSRKEISRRLKKEQSDKILTPKQLSNVRSRGGGTGFEPLRHSKVSDVDLKEEIIKDLTEQKYKGSKKQLKRQVSSQFSNYMDRRANIIPNKVTISSHFSDQSQTKIREISHLTNKLNQIYDQAEREDHQNQIWRNLTD